MLAFLTVGSTRFDSLVSFAFGDEFLSSLRTKGFTSLVIQCGNSAFELADNPQNGEKRYLKRGGVDIEYWKFHPALDEEYRKADLIISHAGSGTILEVLRMGKPLIVVPNPTLLDNHQQELASALQTMGYLATTTVEELPAVVEHFPFQMNTFPPFDPSRFARVVDEAMGFI
ncbi:glycosyl transferase [Pholiota conissans]|uniref:UDP-N-acetylglucosamine transferase subunit ALG13 n=1 Tax=Pholiota conissans TaxID=109636 RepID=A0A9P5Z0C1_9AGAR|nr:glycosyl transferase [Pholiota conissans]